MVRKRYEWGALSPSQRISYISAVKCMQNKPPVLPTKHFPGVRSRMDDFAATHINYTLGVHFNGVFLAWHRHFIWIWERALRDECGYNGTLPYWDWPLSANDLGASPLFDGSPTSLSGNGNPNIQPTNLTENSAARNINGGCVTSGPFANLQLTLPDLSDPMYLQSFPSNAFDYTPRCFARDLNSTRSRRFLNEGVVNSLLTAPDLRTFQIIMDGGSSPEELLSNNNVGPHSAGHQCLGPTMADFYGSALDPAFYLHHGMVDRIWALWQAQYRATRVSEVYGTQSLFNKADTPNVTLDTQLSWGVLGGPRRLEQLMDTHRDEYCYEYV
ncbi:hypothetical protein EYZ11_010376 [Aspergillus tanneri]|uniref:Tyrosinase copper-binding domain-containing protein n=1 Tax=Aspergillus tanneri TaxID=1220188 RepID=A0A4S3J5H3_9EURO|nr:uncharacterized protein ATNIH1004_011240 [Aspergillus tanneri]KAA8642298.1 hypothetical protein ATNIH1004_011240 [Aspergillus tanneri]THC90166.1 hypothetical protein EYZ11_010376 [Aspergillus tanneri]